MADGAAVTEQMRSAIVAALPRLRRFCQAMAGNPDDGDDLMQATVERALSRHAQFEPGSRVDSWMFRIAQNLHIDGVRSRQRRGVSLPIDDLPDQLGEDGRAVVEGRSDLAMAQHALSQLPEDQRAAFALVVIDGLSYREAAETLEVPIGTIMSRIARARGRIGEVLNAMGEVKS